jgi:hypothetical protein
MNAYIFFRRCAPVLINPATGMEYLPTARCKGRGVICVVNSYDWLIMTSVLLLWGQPLVLTGHPSDEPLKHLDGRQSKRISTFWISGRGQGMSRLSSLRMGTSGPDDEPRQRPSRTVSWDTHIEFWLPPSRSVTWSTHVEVFIIPARKRAPDDCDPPCAISARDCATEDCASRASTTTGASPPPPARTPR